MVNDGGVLFRKPSPFLVMNYPFSKYAKFSKKLPFFSHNDTHKYVNVSGDKKC